MNGKWEGSQLNKAKEVLAYELTNLVHGEEEAKKAQEGARALFAGGANTENMPSTELTDEDFQEGSIDLITMLVKPVLCQAVPRVVVPSNRVEYPLTVKRSQISNTQ